MCGSAADLRLCFAYTQTRVSHDANTCRMIGGKDLHENIFDKTDGNCQFCYVINNI